MYKKLIVFLLLFHTLIHAMDENSTKVEVVDLSDESFSLSKTEKLVWTNVAIGSVILIWGATQWDYGSEDFHFDDEGMPILLSQTRSIFG